MSHVGRLKTEAIISPGGLYRYWLEREVPSLESRGTMGFVMLNPSTADACSDDPTIRRCRRFALREGMSRLVVANLFGRRSTDPTGLQGESGASYNEGERSAWVDVFKQSDVIVAAWGAPKTAWLARMMEHRIARVAAYAGELRKDMVCLGMTAKGHPRHPLYVRGTAPLIPFTPGATSD